MRQICRVVCTSVCLKRHSHHRTRQYQNEHKPLKAANKLKIKSMTETTKQTKNPPKTFIIKLERETREREITVTHKTHTQRFIHPWINQSLAKLPRFNEEKPTQADWHTQTHTHSSKVLHLLFFSCFWNFTILFLPEEHFYSTFYDNSFKSKKAKLTWQRLERTVWLLVRSFLVFSPLIKVHQNSTFPIFIIVIIIIVVGFFFFSTIVLIIVVCYSQNLTAHLNHSIRRLLRFS